MTLRRWNEVPSNVFGSRWPFQCLVLALLGAAPCACGLDPREPSLVDANGGGRDGGLGGSSLGNGGAGGSDFGSGASGGSDVADAGLGGSDLGSGCTSGMKSCGGGACIPMAECCESCGALQQCDGNGGCECQPGAVDCDGVCRPAGSCCADGDCGGPGVGACGSDAQCSCLGSAFGVRCEGRFIGLGVVGLVDSDSEARAVSGDGRVVAGWSGTGTGQPHAARWVWEGGQSQILGELESNGTSIALAVSHDGSAIVGDASLQRSGNNSTAGFAWTQATGMVALAPDELSQFTHAEAVTSDGDIVVGWADNDGNIVGADWQGLGSSMRSISSPPEVIRLFAVDGNGSLYGGDVSPGIPVTYNSESGTFQVLSTGPFSRGSIAAISRSGAYRAGTMDETQAVRWFGGVGDPQELGPGVARDVNDDGLVVGESEGVAVFWDPAGQKTEVLSLLEAANAGSSVGWSLERANAVSDDGRVIAGAGTRGGRQEGWVVRLPDMP